MLPAQFLSEAKVLLDMFRIRTLGEVVESRPVHDLYLFCTTGVAEVQESPQFETIGLLAAYQLGARPLEGYAHVVHHEGPQRSRQPWHIDVEPRDSCSIETVPCER